LEEEITKIRMLEDATTEHAGKFAVIPSDFKMSYVSHEEFGLELNSYVGPSAAGCPKTPRTRRREAQCRQEPQAPMHTMKVK
jgi:hypothetical protein